MTQDRRIKKTDQALREALAFLLVEKKLHEVTVKELTEKANVHRSTFYLHYRDVYDLYEKIENQALLDLDQLFSIDTSHSYEKLYEELIHYILQQPQLFRMLLLSKGDTSFQEKVVALAETNYLKIWLYEDEKKVITEEMRYFTVYHLTGCMALLREWLEGNFHYPQEKLLTLLLKLDRHLEKIMP